MTMIPININSHGKHYFKSKMDLSRKADIQRPIVLKQGRIFIESSNNENKIKIYSTEDFTKPNGNIIGWIDANLLKKLVHKNIITLHEGVNEEIKELWDFFLSIQTSAQTNNVVNNFWNIFCCNTEKLCGSYSAFDTHLSFISITVGRLSGILLKLLDPYVKSPIKLLFISGATCYINYLLLRAFASISKQLFDSIYHRENKFQLLTKRKLANMLKKDKNLTTLIIFSEIGTMLGNEIAKDLEISGKILVPAWMESVFFTFGKYMEDYPRIINNNDSMMYLMLNTVRVLFATFSASSIGRLVEIIPVENSAQKFGIELGGSASNILTLYFLWKLSGYTIDKISEGVNYTYSCLPTFFKPSEVEKEVNNIIDRHTSEASVEAEDEKTAMAYR